MLVLRRSHAAETAPADRFRGTMQRWTLTNDARRATVCDYEFCADWSLPWRVVAGPRQGQVGRSRRFQVQQVRPDAYLITFATTPGATHHGGRRLRQRHAGRVRFRGRRNAVRSRARCSSL